MGALLTLVGNFIANFLVKMFFAILEKSPEWLVGNIFDRISGKKKALVPSETTLIDPNCGNASIDLQQQRLKVSMAFGSYFAGLLERDQSYVYLKDQIQVAGGAQKNQMDPFQSIYWSLNNPRGPQVLLIAAEGGMGKSTLAAKIIRCLFSENAVDLILGDSAKTQEVDPVDGSVKTIDPVTYNMDTFLKRVCYQLGLTYAANRSNQQRALSRIKDRLEGQHAVIIVDNLETIENGADLLNALRLLTNRDVRVIVTTRKVSGISGQTPGIQLVHLNPIQNEEQTSEFFQWHIRVFSKSQPGLSNLEADLKDKNKIKLLMRRSGGIPLLMQLILSDVARSTWTRVEKMPEVFGKDLLNFLYQERWGELGQMGLPGQDAQALLHYVRQQMFRGKVSDKDLNNWAVNIQHIASVEPPLHILEERFLIINSDRKNGSYAIFPSLVEFLDQKRAGKL